MASYVTPKKNTAYVFYTGLVDQADTKKLKSSPTLATGDAKVSIDGGAFANLTTDLDVDPNSSVAVKVSLSAAEMNGDNIVVSIIDPDNQWCDQLINIQTTARQVDDLAYPATSGRSMDIDASGQMKLGSTAAGAITATSLATDSITSDEIAASAATEIGGSAASGGGMIK